MSKLYLYFVVMLIVLFIASAYNSGNIDYFLKNFNRRRIIKTLKKRFKEVPLITINKENSYRTGNLLSLCLTFSSEVTGEIGKFGKQNLSGNVNAFTVKIPEETYNAYNADYVLSTMFGKENVNRMNRAFEKSTEGHIPNANHSIIANGGDSTSDECLYLLSTLIIYDFTSVYKFMPNFRLENDLQNPKQNSYDVTYELETFFALYFEKLKESIDNMLNEIDFYSFQALDDDKVTFSQIYSEAKIAFSKKNKRDIDETGEDQESLSFILKYIKDNYGKLVTEFERKNADNYIQLAKMFLVKEEENE